MSNDTSNRATNVSGGISRRQVTRAAAWSVPVIAAAVAAPLAAASVTNLLSLAILNGDNISPDGLSATFAEVNLNEPSVPLILGVSASNPAGPASGPLTAALSANASGTAAWDGVPGNVFVADVVDGSVVLPFEALGYGSFTLTVSMGNQTWLLTVAFSA